MTSAPYVVVGAGQAGLQVCDSLRKAGYDGELVLLGEEPDLPYQRPPLSKHFLAGDVDAARLAFRPQSYYEKQGIDLRPGTLVTAIDRAAHCLALGDGSHLDYARLALTTGARIRPLSCPGHDLDAIHYVRTLDDSRRLAARLAQVEHVTVVGGGFIGLEVAAVARKLGKSVVLVEALERLMARAVSPMVSAFYADLHRARGVDLRLECGVAAIEPADRGVRVVLADGSGIETGLVVAGIGVLPNVELAEQCGLECRNGIVVDEQARTADPDIVAAGDCTWHANAFLGREIRLESVQNAVDQSKVAAAAMCDRPETYRQVPWFWSDQYDVKLQMAGIGMPYDAYAVRGTASEAGFSIFYFRDGALAGADSINRPAEHMACRKLLQQGTMLEPEQAADLEVDLMKLARA